ncbi:Conserved hypothetical protein CHP01589, plant [Dillenia turbinata]|uniref:Uncharacterized protein n=1 Tax=Dillenia turbinata TaxID=194707 RepID=A0AAN8V997_9MAGN
MGHMQCNGHSDRQNHVSGSNNNSINPTEFIDYVHYLIEQCLVRYMSKKETLEILSQRDRIDPELTALVENSSVRQLQQSASDLAPEHWDVAEGGQSAPCIAPESFHYHTVSSLKDQNLFTRAQSESVPTPVSMVSNHNFTMDTSKARVMNKDALVNDANFMSQLENLPQLRVTRGAANGNTSDHRNIRPWTPGVTDPPEDLHYGEGSTELNDNPFPSIMEPSIRDNLSTSAECNDIVSEFLVEEPQMYAQNGEGMDPQQ